MFLYCNSNGLFLLEFSNFNTEDCWLIGWLVGLLSCLFVYFICLLSIAYWNAVFLHKQRGSPIDDLEFCEKLSILLNA
jgi:uncharacterized membrane protein